jgi:hypothetical protein
MAIKPEKKAEIILWDWLKDYGEVYFNRENVLPNPLNKTFRVKGESREMPDLLFITRLFGKDEVIAIEVKDGDCGSNIRCADKIFYKYLLNHYNQRTQYFVGDKEVQISKFLVATQYSPQAHLFGYGDLIQSNQCMDEDKKWKGKVVPKLEYIRTKDFLRSIMQDYSKWRNDNKIRECFGLGVLISDLIYNFTEEELNIQSGMIGKPIIQCIQFNSKSKRWTQSVVKI